MQVPSSLNGLKAVLKGLGFPGAIDGVDVASPNAAQQVLDHIEWKANEDPNGYATKRKRASDLVRLFDWSSVVKADADGPVTIPAPEGTEVEVFTPPKKTGKKKFVIHSPTRTIELQADLSAMLDDMVERLSKTPLPASVSFLLEEAAELLAVGEDNE